MNNLEREIIDTLTNSRESQSDFRAIMKLIENDGAQIAFNKWLRNEIVKRGRDGWWKPMCLFRSLVHDKNINS